MAAGNYDWRLQGQAYRLIKALEKEEQKQSQLDNRAYASKKLVDAIKEDCSVDSRTDLYCYIAAEFLRHYKQYIPDATRLTKKELRAFIRSLPFPNKAVKSASIVRMADFDAGSAEKDETDLADGSCIGDTNDDSAVEQLEWRKKYRSFDEETPEAALPERTERVSPRPGEDVISPLIERAIPETHKSGVGSNCLPTRDSTSDEDELPIDILGI